jgi:hypothetical protein
LQVFLSARLARSGGIVSGGEGAAYELEAPAITEGDPRLGSLVRACGETGTLALAGTPMVGEASRAHIGVLEHAETGTVCWFALGRGAGTWWPSQSLSS